MENECFQLPRFKGSCQPSQLVVLVIDFSIYMNHLYFLKASPKSFKCMLVLKELGV